MADEKRLPDRQRAEEFMELYSASQRRLYVYIVMLLGNPMDAHDVLQDTNLVLWEKFDQFERGTNFHAWAREVARYRVLRYRQLHTNDTAMLGPQVLDALAARVGEVDARRDELYSEAMIGCTEKLSPADHELIVHRYADGVKVATLAKRLQRSENAISQSLSRIRRLLRKCVEETVRQEEEKGAQSQ